jgi:hypothetical protein
MEGCSTNKSQMEGCLELKYKDSLKNGMSIGVDGKPG